MKEYVNLTLNIMHLETNVYEKLMDFLEDNNISYNEHDIDLYTIDERSEDEQYEDWLSEQADLYNDEKWMGLINE